LFVVVIAFLIILKDINSSKTMNKNNNSSRVNNELDMVTATPEMCAICFDSVVLYLNPRRQHQQQQPKKNKNKNRYNPQSDEEEDVIDSRNVIVSSSTSALPLSVLDDPNALSRAPYDKCFPLFVTWNKWSHSSEEYHLRGCIGTFSQSVPLCESLPDYAKTSAFEDSRFSPITGSELAHLKCSVSLLIDFEEANDVFDWTIGVHGIRISFPSDPSASQYSRTLGGTYLPDVCVEQEWTKEECLHSLYRKAGFRGTVTKSLMRKTKLVRYKSSKCHMTYEEYQKLIQNKVEHTGSGEE